MRVEQQLEGEIGMAGFGEFFKQIGRAEEAGAEQAVVGFDFVDEVLGGGGAEIFGQQVHVQSKDVAGLRVSAVALASGLLMTPKAERLLSAPATKPSLWTNCFSKAARILSKRSRIFFFVVRCGRWRGPSARMSVTS